ADKRDVASFFLINVVEIAAFARFDAFYVGDIGSGRADVNPKQMYCTKLHITATVFLGADILNRAAVNGQGRSVVERYVFVAPARGVERRDAREIFDRIFLYGESIRADVCNLLIDVGVEAFDQRDDH